MGVRALASVLPLIEGLAAAGEARVLPEEAGGGHGGGLTSAHRGPRSLCPGSARLCCQAAIFSACFGRQLLSVRTIDIPGPSLCRLCALPPRTVSARKDPSTKILGLKITICLTTRLFSVN